MGHIIFWSVTLYDATIIGPGSERLSDPTDHITWKCQTPLYLFGPMPIQVWNMIIRKLIPGDREALYDLISVIESTLPNEEFWLPIKEMSREHYFDDSWTEFYGAFVDGRLIGASALFYDSFEFGESMEQLGMCQTGVAEVGRSMVHPDHRGHNVLASINRVLIDRARSKGLNMLLATIHPDNMPSQCSFRGLDFVKRKTYLKSDGFVRDIYTFDL